MPRVDFMMSEMIKSLALANLNYISAIMEEDQKE